jgi:hypothetical protein
MGLTQWYNINIVINYNNVKYFLIYIYLFLFNINYITYN